MLRSPSFFARQGAVILGVFVATVCVAILLAFAAPRSFRSAAAVGLPLGGDAAADTAMLSDGDLIHRAEAEAGPASGGIKTWVLPAGEGLRLRFLLLVECSNGSYAADLANDWANLAVASAGGNSAVVRPAKTPAQASRPHVLRYGLIGAFFGLLGGVGIALLRHGLAPARPAYT